MGKNKIIIGILIIVCIILCMFTIYKHTQYNNMRIAYNIKDREMIMLKEDYEKLYKAYYEYDKKVLKLLEGNPNVFWGIDSSSYAIRQKDHYIFSFYKKPRMEGECYLWWNYHEGTRRGYVLSLFQKSLRVDTLKSHQFLILEMPKIEMKALIVGDSIFTAENPQSQKRLVEIPLDFHF